MDERTAKEMIGKLVLVGVNEMSTEGAVLSQAQYYGIVLRISDKDGLIIAREDNGEEMWLPPALEYYERAEPGEYRLRSNGQVVTDPDYVATFDRYPSEDE